ncbi:hypothetical protein [Mesorhizobium sp.]|nr:hypothetical protein [Mesorhizobium sp.]
MSIDLSLDRTYKWNVPINQPSTISQSTVAKNAALQREKAQKVAFNC